MGVQDNSKGAAEGTYKLSTLKIGLVAPAAGLAVGILIAAFRWFLDQLNTQRESLIHESHHWGGVGLLALIVLAAVLVMLAAWMVRRFEPAAAGSGIPRVMSVLDNEIPPAGLRVIPVKFFAGALAIGSGLAVGREGPSVQMGASLSYHIGHWLRLSWTETRALLAAGAGAGFAAAFGAPLAGPLFVLETIVKRFEIPIAVGSLAAAVAAVWVSGNLLGTEPEFSLNIAAVTGPTLILYILLGCCAGFAGVLYNSSIHWSLNTTKRLTQLPVEFRAAIIAAVVALVGWFSPELLGGGEELAKQALRGEETLLDVAGLFVLRLLLIAWSVAGGTPGGLLVPFLVLGADLGCGFGLVSALLLPSLNLQAGGFALVGMAALFAAIIRAPLTGVVLVTEIANDTTLLLPMCLACAAATIVSTALGCEPMLDSLRQHPPVELSRKDHVAAPVVR